MSGFADWFESGRAVDLILIVMAVEALVLIVVRKRAVLTVALTLLPGTAILLAARAAVTGASWHWIALWLTVSLPLHLADLRHRRLL